MKPSPGAESHLIPCKSSNILCLTSPNCAVPVPGLGNRDTTPHLAKGPEMLLGFLSLALFLLGSLTLQEEVCQETVQPLLLQMAHTQPGWDWRRDSRAGKRY